MVEKRWVSGRPKLPGCGGVSKKPQRRLNSVRCASKISRVNGTLTAQSLGLERVALAGPA